MILTLLTQLDRTQFPTRTLAISTTSASTTAWPAGADGVVLFSDVQCFATLNPGTATSADFPIPPNTMVPLRNPTNQSFAVTAVGVGNGTLYATPVSYR